MASKLSELTSQAYRQQYNNLKRSANSQDPSLLLQFILNKEAKVSTKTNNLNSIISLMKAGEIDSKGIEELREARDKLQEEVKRAVAKDNLGKYRAKVANIHIEDLDRLLELLYIHRNDDTASKEDYLLFSLMWPQPLRNDLQDITLCSNYKNRSQTNCLYLPKDKSKNGELRINEHKTTSRGGEPIVRPLNKFQTTSARELFADGRTYLFQTRSGQPLSSSGMSNKINALTNKWLKVPLTSTALRKIYYSGKYRKLMNEMRDDAKQLGHSIEVAQSHYLDNKR
jgi:integrase